MPEIQINVKKNHSFLDNMNGSQHLSPVEINHYQTLRTVLLFEAAPMNHMVGQKRSALFKAWHLTYSEVHSDVAALPE